MRSVKIWKGRTCKQCGTIFDTGDIRQWLCTSACKIAYFNAKRAATKHEERKCVVCGNSFVPNQARGVGRKWCTEECRKTILRGYKSKRKTKKDLDAEKKKKASEYQKEWIKKMGGHRAIQLKRDFGITVEQYDEMLKGQDSVCAICGKPETSRNKYRDVQPLAVDHCHTTGKVRALLCSNCNRGLGCFKDDPDLLLKAVSYLRKHNDQPS